MCPVCGQRLAFENSVCLSCSSQVGFDLPSRAFLVVDDEDSTLRRCLNQNIAVCNWLVPAGPARLCVSCALTRTRPSDGDVVGMSGFALAEAAKRRLVVELAELGLPMDGRAEDPEGGLCFDLLSSAKVAVVTGHSRGVITVDLAEGDDVHREQLRASMDEPYRTLLGHFRHEIGHYYYLSLVERGSHVEQFEELFGDPATDYAAALQRHYRDGPPPQWSTSFISSYATMHPAEDWAETFAHYLHIRDTIDTAAAFGLAPAGATADSPLPGDTGFERIVELWLPLTWSLNMINRSMGHPDLYPFVLPAPALEKMRFVHRLVTGASD